MSRKKISVFFIGEGLLLPADDGAEGQQRELRLLEALEAEGDADDGDAQQHAVEQGLEGEEDAAEYEPEHVEDGGAGSAILNVLWFIFGGVFLALEALLNGVLLCITVIGIPFGLQCFKQAKLALLPFGAVVRGK